MIPTPKERNANDFPGLFFSHICKCAAKKRCVWNFSAFKDLFQMAWVSLYLERHWACQSLHRGTYAVGETLLTLEDMLQMTLGVCPQPWKALSMCFSKSPSLYACGVWGCKFFNIYCIMDFRDKNIQIKLCVPNLDSLGRLFLEWKHNKNDEK